MSHYNKYIILYITYKLTQMVVGGGGATLHTPIRLASECAFWKGCLFG